MLILTLIREIWKNLLTESFFISGSLPPKQVPIKNKLGNSRKFNLNTDTSILFSQLQSFSTLLLLQNFVRKIRNIPNFDAIVTNSNAFMDVKMNMRYEKELPFYKSDPRSFWQSISVLIPFTIIVYFVKPNNTRFSLETETCWQKLRRNLLSLFIAIKRMINSTFQLNKKFSYRRFLLFVSITFRSFVCLFNCY